jgi:hypothetical protein
MLQLGHLSSRLSRLVTYPESMYNTAIPEGVCFTLHLSKLLLTHRMVQFKSIKNPIRMLQLVCGITRSLEVVDVEEWAR